MILIKYSLKSITRSPAFWVVLSLLMVLIPHLPRLPVWVSAFIIIVFLWRLLIIKYNAYFPNKWLLSIIASSACIGIIFHYGTIMGKTAGTTFLAILLAIKLLESKQDRDYMLIIAISFFVIGTNFLFSQSIATVIYMLVTVIILITSMMSINLNNLDIDLKQKFKISTQLVFQALPLMLILFLLFPRIPGPLWRLPDDSTSATSGLSNTMSPGNISELVQSNSVAFRVKFKNQPPSQDKLYWRAMILWYFDGQTWEQGKTNISPFPTFEGIDKLTEYSITLEPHDKKYLFALDMPAVIPSNITYNANYLLRSDKKIDSLYQYNVSSFLNYRIGHKLSAWELSSGLKIPESTNPKTIDLGRKWKNTFKKPVYIIAQALKYFSHNEFLYSLRPPLTPGFDPIDQFLFNTRKGFCEHYASSFTLLMRAAGIPARVVVGYQGGQINPLNQFLTVRQRDAHAWSEVWLEDSGWIRIDPTSVVAPERIEQGLNAALSSNEYRPLHMYLDYGVLKKLNFYWDAIDNSWKQWVIGYNSKLQHQLLSSIFNRYMNLYDITITLIIALFLATTITIFYIFRSTSKSTIDPVQKIYEKFCSKLSKKGLTREIYEGPEDFSGRAIEKLPHHKDMIELITLIYISLRFKSKYNEKYLKKFKHTVKLFKPK